MADQDVLFRLGLTEHPGTAAALRKLSGEVQGAMKSVEGSVANVGAVAKKTSEAIPTSEAKEYEDQLNRLKGVTSELGQATKPLATNQDKAKNSTAALVQTLEKQASTLSELQEKGSQLGSSLSGNFREMASKAEESASAIGQVASGVAFLFADSEDAKALVDTLLTIKGTADVVLGSFKTVSGAAQVFSLMKDRTKALTDQTRVQTQQQKLAQKAVANYVEWLDREGIELTQVTNGNKAHAAQLRKAALEARQAAAAEEQLARSRTKADHARALGGRLGGGIAPRGSRRILRGRAGGAVGGIIASLGGEAVFGALGGGVAGGVGSTALGSLGGGSLGAAGGVAASGGAIAAIVGAIALLGKTIVDGFRGKAEGNFNLFGLTRNISGRADQFLGLDTANRHLVDSIDAVTAASERLAAAKEKELQASLDASLSLIREQAARQGRDFNRATLSQSRGLAVSTGDIGATLAANLNLADAQKELERSTKAVRDFEDNITHDKETYLDALKRSKDLYVEIEGLQKAVVAASKQEAAERQKINQDGLSAAQERLGLLERERGILRGNVDKLDQAASVFATLSKGDQLKALEAKRALDSGTEITNKQRELLGRIGLEDTSEKIRRLNIQDARRGGFFDAFGSFEQRGISGSLRRLDDLSSLQKIGRSISAEGSPRRREAQLRELRRRQREFGDEQSDASGRSARERPLEREFDQLRTDVRVEIADRRFVQVQIEADQRAIARTVRAEIEKFRKQESEVLKKLIEDDEQKSRAKTIQDFQARAQQLKNSQPS